MCPEPARPDTAAHGYGHTGMAEDLARRADLITPLAIRVAATLRLADHIAAGRRTAPELAEAAGADPDAVGRLVRHLVAEGVFGEGYSLGPLGHELLDGSGLRSRLDMEGALGRGDLAFTRLLDAVRTGEPVYPAMYGRSFWDDTADPARAPAYDDHMSHDVGRWTSSVLAACDWSRFGHVVDVGGGDGSLLAALLDAHPGLRGTVLEQPGTAERARAKLADWGDRADAVAGSFFDPLPAGGDAYLLCAILHDWPDAEAQAILRRCAEAAGAEGRVLVVERTGPGGQAPSTAMDLRMLVLFGGRERTASQIAELAASAGLQLVKAHQSGDISVVELRPT